MRVLVTGSAGFIGQAVCAALVAKGYEPVSFDSPYDVRNRNDVFEHVKTCDAVINLAGVLGTAEILGAERDAADVNILGALNVMDACEHFKAPLVQISAGHEGQLNPYAITKKCSTDLCLSRAKWRNSPIAVVRAYHAYGPGQKMCAPHGKSKVRKIIPSFVARAITGMPLEINGNGNQKVDLVHVDDVAEVLVSAIAGPYGVLLEAGTGIPTSVNKAARDVIEACGSESLITHGPMRDGEMPDTDTVAAKALCSNPWPHGLLSTIDWYRKALAKAA